MVALRALVRVAPRTPLPRTLTWSGLDSLLGLARQTTFGISVTVPDTAVLHGVRDRVAVDVVASRPATFLLRIVRPGVSDRANSSIRSGRWIKAPCISRP